MRFRPVAALWAWGWSFPPIRPISVSNRETAGFLNFFSCWLAMPTGARYPLKAPPVEGPVGKGETTPRTVGQLPSDIGSAAGRQAGRDARGNDADSMTESSPAPLSPR
jgi:hypothetical protein